MTTIHVLTGGIGAGKTTLAPSLGLVCAQADLVREELKGLYPDVDWFNKTQAYKDTPHPALSGQTPRAYIIRLAEEKVSANGLDYFAKQNILRMAKIQFHNSLRRAFSPTFVVDDVRRLAELERYRYLDTGTDRFRVIHWHLKGGIQDTQPTATPMEEFEKRANYVITRGLTPLVG